MTYDLQDEFQKKMYIDQTGRFSTKFNRGYQYIMVVVELDSDTILVEPMKNRTSKEMIQAYQVLVDRLKTSGVYPKHHMLHNESSQDFKYVIKRNNMTYQLATAHDHRRIIAEKAIQTFKHCFIAILYGTDDTFPMHLWCRLLEQDEHTLHMLWPSRIAPKVWAYAHLYGMHSYNANPFAPLGCKVEIYEMPSVREA